MRHLLPTILLICVIGCFQVTEDKEECPSSLMSLHCEDIEWPMDGASCWCSNYVERGCLGPGVALTSSGLYTDVKLTGCPVEMIECLRCKDGWIVEEL